MLDGLYCREKVQYCTKWVHWCKLWRESKVQGQAVKHTQGLPNASPTLLHVLLGHWVSGQRTTQVCLCGRDQKPSLIPAASLTGQPAGSSALGRNWAGTVLIVKHFQPITGVFYLQRENLRPYMGIHTQVMQEVTGRYWHMATGLSLVKVKQTAGLPNNSSCDQQSACVRFLSTKSWIPVWCIQLQLVTVLG